MCLDLVNVYGNSPIMLFADTNKKTEIIIRLIFIFFFLMLVINSEFSLSYKIVNIMVIREGVVQILGGIIINPIIVLYQFIDKLILVDGSNEEKRLAIIFSSVLAAFVCLLRLFLV